MSTREELKRDQKRFASWIFIAAAAHAALVVLSFLMQLYYLRTHPPVKIVNVSLVTLPGSPGPAGGAPSVPQPPAQQPAPEAPAPKAPEPKKIPEPVVAKKTVPDEKSKPANPEKTEKANIQDALSRLKQQTEKKESGQRLGSTLANLQKKVASQGKGPAQGSGTGGGGGLYGTGGGASDPYKSKIAGIIQDNWSFSQQLVRNARGMEVYVAINILPNGTISQIRFDRRAPSEYLNNSVKAALLKSSPLPVFPREYGSKPIWIGFVFTPEGVSQ
jgi:colicin import membrane protein